METEEAVRRLALFGIPAGADAAAEAVRGALAPLVADGSLALGELQTARDITARTGVTEPAAYLFLAAMFLSLRGGHAAFDPARGPTVGDDALWARALAAAEGLRGDTVVREASGLWYFAKHAEAVRFLSDALGRRLAAGGGPAPSEATLREAARYSGFELEEGQRQAVRAAATHRLALVAGGPGTGKTTIVCSLLRALFAADGLTAADVALVAPTGRAAARMGEALRDQCRLADGADAAARAVIATLAGRTVHALLGGRAPDWRHDARHPLPHRVVVVDEVSMVDLLLMRALVAALREDCRLVLLGDRDQLPSVGAGAVFGDLVARARREGGGGALAELTVARRFTGGLRTCAEDVRRGGADAVTAPARRLPVAGEAWTRTVARAQDECWWYRLPDGSDAVAALPGLIDAWAEAHGLGRGGELACAAGDVTEDDLASLAAFARSDKARRLFKALDASRILTVVREGPFGAASLNAHLLGGRGLHGAGRGRALLTRGGVPVAVTRNTPALGLFNGDVGVTVRTREGVSALFRRGEGVVRCPVALLPEHEPAYALTVHRAQGSEFGDVLVVLPGDAAHPLLSRPLVYTGLTRAKTCAVLLATEPALRAALARTLPRLTGLA